MAYTKEEREKNKSILLATLNYLLEYHSGDMVFDDYSPSKDWYLGDIKKTELDIKKYRSKQIKRRLDMHISLLRHHYDQGLNNYIKENTGYNIDIFEEFKINVMPIISKGRIVDNDVYLIENYLKAYGTHPEEQENVDLLKGLLAKRETEISRLKALGGLITIEGYSVVQGKNSWTMNAIDYHKLSKKWLLCEEIAPNGFCKLSVQISGKGEHALTYVNISLRGGVGGVYGAKGEKLPIKVYWKDDHNVIIETKKEYKSIFRYKQVSSYGELVKIEYRFA
ncbi:hypothetical protein EZ428_02340 [Pedobacter frigiditerrae]|uniref:Uncharacterized protein n=1 Tax=Pedobacter frigiditerrae TaxID=2530452 RepID=A0A4R0N1H1_9SPHI|nr:hypothetical protein [Pedobacter frigiditerrae]TCC93629.1 hypothetical protein EZ428_02340 [Pedobacter frigiditerrae]